MEEKVYSYPKYILFLVIGLSVFIVTIFYFILYSMISGGRVNWYYILAPISVIPPIALMYNLYSSKIIVTEKGIKQVSIFKEIFIAWGEKPSIIFIPQTHQRDARWVLSSNQASVSFTPMIVNSPDLLNQLQKYIGSSGLNNSDNTILIQKASSIPKWAWIVFGTAILLIIFVLMYMMFIFNSRPSYY